MPGLDGPPPLGSEPLAAVFGGILLLGASAVVLVLRKDRLRNGGRLGHVTGPAFGALLGAAAYLAGIAATGRGGELLAPRALVETVPWALLLAAGFAAVVGWAAGARTGWHPAGVGILASMVVIATGWAAYLLTTRIPSVVGTKTLVGFGIAFVLFAQLLALVLLCSVTVYMLDGLVRRRWIRDSAAAPYDPSYVPKVAVHVACYDEPPELVAETLDSLVAQDYPRSRLHVMLVDDSRDPVAVETLRAMCAARGVAFVHRDDRRGFKAGALNHALLHTPSDVELVAVVDADFIVKPGFIRDNVGYFVDQRLAFVQTKLGFRNAEDSFTARYATMMEHFFYTSMMRTRNEGNSILFCGTMGILRRSAIEAVGGWTDGHVGEDVDLSCRMLATGWKSLYVARVDGHGIQTVDQEAFRRQQARWAFGGARILRDHGWAILRSRMTLRQKAHHLYPPFFWMDGSLALMFAGATAVFSLAFLTGRVSWMPVHELVFVGLVPVVLLAENMLRAGFTMRRLLGIGHRDVGAMILMGWSGKLHNGLSAWAAVLGIERPFARTPKTDAAVLTRAQAIAHTVRVAPAETAIAATLLALLVATTTKLAVFGSGAMPFVLVLAGVVMTLVWTLYFGAAPLCVYLNHRSRARRLARGSSPVLVGSRSPRAVS